jgi:hypothetical protein
MAEYYNAPSGTPYSPPNSTMAIISLVAGVLGLTFIPFLGSIAAVILGSMAKKEIRESNGALGGDGLATVGLVLGWIGIAMGVIGLCIFGSLMAIPLCAIITEGSRGFWLAPMFTVLF